MSRSRLSGVVERCALRAWPAHETIEYDGWELRHSNGFTRRANSVQVLGASSLPLTEKVAVLEARYVALGRQLRFRLTEMNDPAVDELLAARGYLRAAPVVTCVRPVAATDGDPSVTVESGPSARWLSARLEWNGQSAAHLDDLRLIVERIEQPGFAAIVAQPRGPVVGVGLGVHDRDFVGLFGLATDPGFRRRGYGSRLAAALLAWGTARGARTAYLQVAASNREALRLYATLGFEPLYEYWYRECP